MIKGIDVGLCLLIFLNVFGFVSMGLDKRKARSKAWRTPESVFFVTALLGGSIGVWLGMQFFRHKTKHKTFTLGIPLILILQIALGVTIGYLS